MANYAKSLGEMATERASDTVKGFGRSLKGAFLSETPALTGVMSFSRELQKRAEKQSDNKIEDATKEVAQEQRKNNVISLEMVRQLRAINGNIAAQNRIAAKAEIRNSKAAAFAEEAEKEKIIRDEKLLKAIEKIGANDSAWKGRKPGDTTTGGGILDFIKNIFSGNLGEILGSVAGGAAGLYGLKKAGDMIRKPTATPTTPPAGGGGAGGGAGAATSAGSKVLRGLGFLGRIGVRFLGPIGLLYTAYEIYNALGTLFGDSGGQWGGKPNNMPQKNTNGLVRNQSGRAIAKERQTTQSATDNIADKIIQAESGGRNVDTQIKDASGKSTSSASGIAQFTKGTFEGLVARSQPGDPLYEYENAEKKIKKGNSLVSKNFQLMKTDVNLQRVALDTLIKANSRDLSKAGMPVNDATLYLAHFLGSAGAIRALSQSDDTLLTNVINPDSLKANKPIFDKLKTVGDLKNWASAKMGMSSNIAAGNQNLVTQGRLSKAQTNAALGELGINTDKAVGKKSQRTYRLKQIASAGGKADNLPPGSTPESPFMGEGLIADAVQDAANDNLSPKSRSLGISPSPSSSGTVTSTGGDASVLESLGRIETNTLIAATAAVSSDKRGKRTEARNVADRTRRPAKATAAAQAKADPFTRYITTKLKSISTGLENTTRQLFTKTLGDLFGVGKGATRSKFINKEGVIPGAIGSLVEKEFQFGKKLTPFFTKIFGKQYGGQYGRMFGQLGGMYADVAINQLGSAFGFDQNSPFALGQILSNFSSRGKSKKKAAEDKKLGREQLIYSLTGIPTGGASFLPFLQKMAPGLFPGMDPSDPRFYDPRFAVNSMVTGFMGPRGAMAGQMQGMLGMPFGMMGNPYASMMGAGTPMPIISGFSSRQLIAGGPGGFGYGGNTTSARDRATTIKVDPNSDYAREQAAIAEANGLQVEAITEQTQVNESGFSGLANTFTEGISGMMRGLSGMVSGLFTGAPMGGGGGGFSLGNIFGGGGTSSGGGGFSFENMLGSFGSGIANLGSMYLGSKISSKVIGSKNPLVQTLGSMLIGQGVKGVAGMALNSMGFGGVSSALGLSGAASGLSSIGSALFGSSVPAAGAMYAAPTTGILGSLGGLGTAIGGFGSALGGVGSALMTGLSGGGFAALGPALGALATNPVGWAILGAAALFGLNKKEDHRASYSLSMASESPEDGNLGSGRGTKQEMIDSAKMMGKLAWATAKRIEGYSGVKADFQRIGASLHGNTKSFYLNFDNGETKVTSLDDFAKNPKSASNKMIGMIQTRFKKIAQGDKTKEAAINKAASVTRTASTPEKAISASFNPPPPKSTSSSNPISKTTTTSTTATKSVVVPILPSTWKNYTAQEKIDYFNRNKITPAQLSKLGVSDADINAIKDLGYTVTDTTTTPPATPTTPPATPAATPTVPVNQTPASTYNDLQEKANQATSSETTPTNNNVLSNVGNTVDQSTKVTNIVNRGMYDDSIAKFGSFRSSEFGMQLQ